MSVRNSRNVIAFRVKFADCELSLGIRKLTGERYATMDQEWRSYCYSSIMLENHNC